MRHPFGATRPLLALTLSLLLAIAAAVVPAAAGPGSPLAAGFATPVARAADGLGVIAATRYVIVPDKALVRVTVDLAVRNESPDRVAGGVVTRYFYDAVNVGVQPEATRFAATQDGVAVSVRVVRKTGYRLVSVGLRQNLYFQESAAVRLSFDLPAGRPRSTSDVRVSRAFATFRAWAFGDSGTVRVEVPAAFTVAVNGEAVEQSTANGTTVLTASTGDAAGWSALVTARNDEALTRTRLEVAGGRKISVRSWPEDAQWRRTVADLLTRGVPALVARIGIPWPVEGPLTVIEVHTPLLEGYAGFYDTVTDQITVSEELDEHAIVHEASHAWFNGGLFSERWITEGLAEEYSSQVLGALGRAVQAPARVARTDKVAFALGAWPPPAAIRDAQSSARERYGYAASWLVIRRVVRAAGDDGMRRVFAAASDRTIAYVGAGPAEPTALPNDWRRFVDLAEEVGGATGIAQLVATWALPDGSDAGLAARAHARTMYRDLLAAGDGWAAPYAVRDPLDRWAYADAEARIGDAMAILRQRDETAALAAAQALTPPGALETAYEGAATRADLTAAATRAAETEAALVSLAAAREAAAPARDWIVALGLDGWDPDDGLATARGAWEAGDVAAAAGGASLVSERLAGAPDAGRRRAALIGGGIAITLLVLALAIRLVLRRSRRRAMAAGVSPAMGAVADGAWPAGHPVPVPPERADRYATLPASEGLPSEAAPPPTEGEGADRS